ncbi:MAG: NAD(P)H-dependent oxidoreductase subunit E, partial [Lactobacillus sp.]|nr:NAD(P)H-dependent oxidoreductase subunit E [Lactobacillus sp.]
MNIKLCMGSSCFARGNAEYLSFLEKYIKDNNLSVTVELSGCRCENCCCDGPNIIVDGKKYNKVDITKIKK